MSGWSCSTCTFYNESPSSTRCEMCETRRPRPILIRIKHARGVNTIELDPEATVAQLKVAVQDVTAIPVPVQRLIQGGVLPKELEAAGSQPVRTALGYKEGGPTPILIVEERIVAPAKPVAPVTGPAGVAGAGEGAGGVDEKNPGGGGGGEPVQSTAAAKLASPSSKLSAEGEVDWGEEPGGAGFGEDDDDEWGDDGGEGGWDDTEITDSADAEEAKRVSAPPLLRQSSYRVMTKEEVLQMQFDLLDEIDDVLGVSAAEAGILLRHYRWKKERLFQDWCTNPDEVREKAGLTKRAGGAREETLDPKASFDCLLCGDAVTVTQTSVLGCGHRYCNTCWRSWLQAEMESKGPQALYTNCIEFKCEEIVPEDMFLKLLEPAQKRMYQSWLVKNFIEGVTDVKWCPGPGCERAVNYPEGGEREITCLCGYQWCFKCLLEAHEPCPCEVVTKWNEKNKSDKENADWLIANTKICPACKVPIEKNQGCNHMTCRNCKHEFCWLCKGAWKEHGGATGGFYKCNVYEEKKAKGEGIAEEMAAADAQNKLQRYLFYFSRFTANDDSAKQAQKMVKEIEAKADNLHTHSDWSRGDFLLDAAKVVIDCRRALKWSYALGFFLPDKTARKAMFENDQAQLEKFADHLHGLIEKQEDELKQEEIRKDIINYTAAANKFMHGLAEAVQSGQYLTEKDEAAMRPKPSPSPSTSSPSVSASSSSAARPTAAAAPPAKPASSSSSSSSRWPFGRSSKSRR